MNIVNSKAPPTFDVSARGSTVGPDPDEEAFVGRLRKIIAMSESANALARKAGISQSGLHRYLNGSDPSRRALIALAEAAGVSVEWLATGAEPDAADPSKNDLSKNDLGTLARMPIYAFDRHPQSAQPIPARTVFTPLAFCREWLREHGVNWQNVMVVTMRGDSMEPTIMNNDNLLIDVAETEFQDGDIVTVNDGERILIRRLQHLLHGRMRMISDNQKYETIDIAASDITMIGKVIWRGTLL